MVIRTTVMSGPCKLGCAVYDTLTLALAVSFYNNNNYKHFHEDNIYGTSDSLTYGPQLQDMIENL